MERSEPSLAPEWLRTNGSSSNFTSSRTDGPPTSIPKQNNASKRSISNSSSHYSSFLGRDSSSSSRRGLNSNAYSSFSRNQSRKHGERLGISDTWGYKDDFDSVKSIIAGRVEKNAPRRTQSTILRKPDESSQRTVFTGLRNNTRNNINGNSSGAVKVDSGYTGIQKELLERGLSNNNASGSNVPEVLVKVPVPDNGTQQSVITQRSKEELHLRVSKQLIPVTPSMPKALAHKTSDKLKSKTATRPIDHAGVVPRKYLHQMAPSKPGNESTRNVSAGGDDSKSYSTGKMLLLKPMREIGVSSAIKDAPCQPVNVSSSSLKNPDKGKLSSTANGLNDVPVVGKRLSVAQLKSRSDFFNTVRNKSIGGGTSSAGSSAVPNSDEVKDLGAVPNSDEVKDLGAVPNSDEVKDLGNGSGRMIANECDVKCDDDTCSSTQDFSVSKESDWSEDAFIYSNEEEKAFLRSLGWEENTGDDEGLTEEEINGFYRKYMECRPASKLLRDLQLKMTQSDQSCYAAAS